MSGSRKRVLVIEDEGDVRELQLVHLRREGLDPVGVETAEEGLSRLQSGESFDLVVLDWMLPGMSGLELLRKLGTDPTRAPVLMVTARADTADVVLGLEAGADDYIIKPFEIPVFLARVRALLRRAGAQKAAGGAPARRFRVGGLSLDLDRHEVQCGGQEVQLTPSEFKLLAALMTHRGRVLSRERLIELIQGEGVSVVDRAIDTHVFGLRKKLGPCAEVIETIRGVGYRVLPEDGPAA